MAWDVAAHEQGDGVAVRCHRIFDFPAPNSRREYSHARRSGLEGRNLPLIAKQSVGLRIVAGQNFRVSTKRMPDGFRDVPFGIALRRNPNHEIWTVAVMQAPLAAERMVMLPRLVSVRAALRRLLPRLTEHLNRRLVARMRQNIIGLEDGDRAAIKIVAGNHHVMPESGLAHRLMLKFEAGRCVCATWEHEP